MERLKDICDLLDSIKAQTLLTQQTQRTQKPDIEHRTWNVEHPIEVIFVAERSRELYEQKKRDSGIINNTEERQELYLG